MWLGHAGSPVCARVISRVQLYATQWTIARQAPLSVGVFKQEYWSGLPFLPPGDLPDPGLEPMSPASHAHSLPMSCSDVVKTPLLTVPGETTRIIPTRLKVPVRAGSQRLRTSSPSFLGVCSLFLGPSVFPELVPAHPFFLGLSLNGSFLPPNWARPLCCTSSFIHGV